MRILAIISLIILSPILLIVSLLIRFSMGSPVIFKQERIGKNKKPFIIYKFRTMENEKITFLGRILRKLGIDELPQLVNIAKGQMAFVGPRPLTEFDIKRLKWNDEFHKTRWKVKPGITGMAQLTNICNVKISWFYDKYYVLNRSFCLDLKIIIKSIIIPFVGKKTKITK
jgi:lipopolysaccharide/colanic/teichoic acid biosynthesis glycosyltransferase